eukprot:1275963-Pleurochrysis_carterae.AAC.1
MRYDHRLWQQKQLNQAHQSTLGSMALKYLCICKDAMLSLRVVELRRCRQLLPHHPIGRSGPLDQDYARLHLAYTLPIDILRDLPGATIRIPIRAGNDC